MLQTVQTSAEGGYTSVFSDASTNLPDQSKIVLHVPTVNVTSLGLAHLEIKDLSSPWFHQKAVALIGLIRLGLLYYIK
jgi:hypothetical protein